MVWVTWLYDTQPVVIGMFETAQEAVLSLGSSIATHVTPVHTPCADFSAAIRGFEEFSQSVQPKPEKGE